MIRRLRPLVALALLALPLRGAAFDPDAGFDLPIPLPARPFLLLEAPRRFTPGEAAAVRVQMRRAGPVRVAAFRVHDPSALVAAEPPRQGLATAATPLGAECEALLARADALPRRGAGLTLAALRDAEVRATRAVRRAVGDETGAYDSNEADEGDVETWGVWADRWSEATVSLGALPAGLYVVRAHAGAWAASALLSVGDLTVLARRGDAHDVVLVTDPEGRPLAHVEVEARPPGGAVLARARTGANGEARLPASDASALRFVARRGEDVAWADVEHARMETCDVRVYLATGRPVFRPGETVHLRGHVRGCVDGAPVPLPNEPVRVRAHDGDPGVAATTDADGNFVAELPAAGALHATVRARDHARTLQLDARRLPERALRVTLDRPWAAAGEAVAVRVADDQGGWPVDARVTVTLPGGATREVAIGPDRPAELRFVVPETREALTRVSVSASLARANVVTLATADLWTGRDRAVLSLTSTHTEGVSGARFPLELRATDLGGDALPGAATLVVRGSDGNRPSGPPRWSGAVTLGAGGVARADALLAGAGPWWLEASRDGARATLVVWDRPRPPALSARGALAVRPAALGVAPGDALDVDLRAPADGGATWVTLEQGGVWASALVPAGAARTRLAVPPAARGLATVVATHVHGGQVATAAAATEVATSRPLALAVATDKRAYAGGETARVVVTATDGGGRPRDGVLSLWLADAGYWELGEEDYPPPDAFLRLPGRRASAGDGTRPRGYGAEEGRRLDTRLEWNGRALPRSSFRHAWGHGGEVVSLDARGAFGAVADGLARAAGLRGADACRERERTLGAVALVARNLPWDLVALRVGEATETEVFVEHGRLRFSCDARTGGSGAGSGAGYGAGRGMRGSGGVGTIREQTLEGTLHFVGARRLGPGGRLALDVPLPDHPGRWRIETLVIADDGGGDRAHAVVTTAQAVEARLDVAPSLAVGDVAAGEVGVTAPLLAGRDVVVSLDAPRWLAVVTAPPRTLRVGADGRARAPFAVRADAVGAQALTLHVRAASGRAGDDVRVPVAVRSDPARRPLAVRAVLGPEPTTVDVPLPDLARPAALDVRVDADLAAGIDDELERLRAPRWDEPSLRVDRLASLRALRSAARALPPDARAPRVAALDRAVASELAALRGDAAPEGGLPWWNRLPPSPLVTAAALWALGDDAPDPAGARATLREAAARAEGAWAAPLAAALARSPAAADRALAAALVRRAAPAALAEVAPGTWLLRASRALGEHELARAHAAALGARVARSLTTVARGRTCGGPAWFLCFARDGERGALARAALELLDADPAGARPLATRVARWLALHPADVAGWQWGSAEADVLALVAALGPASAADTRFEVRRGGAVLARGDARTGATVVVREGGPLEVVFAAAPGRATRVRVDGALDVAPAASPAGPAALARRVEGAGGARALVLEFALARDAARVELTAPLPAGLELAAAAGGRAAHREDAATPFDWFAFDRAPSDARPRVERAEGAVRVRFRRLRAGRHVVRLPLAAVAAGTFTAAPAWLAADGEDVWAVTPPLTVRLPPGG